MRGRLTRNLSTALIAGILSTACSSANAVAIDENNDIHCSVLAFYFHGLAKHEGAPAEQVRATKGLQDWYATKLRAVGGGRFSEPAVMQSEIAPILEAIKADPLSMRGKTKACAERASAEPAFDKFARSYMRP
jgi:hypothetical protein